MNNETGEIEPEDLETEDEFTDEYETHNEGTIRKINSVLNNRKIGSRVKEAAKKRGVLHLAVGDAFLHPIIKIITYR
jgi:hypothetical protein